MTASATNPVVWISWGGPSLNQSMTFQDSDVSNNTSPSIILVFTTDLVYSRAFTYVSIDVLLKILSVLHSPLSDFVSLKFFHWILPMAEWKKYISPPGFVPDALLISNESGRLEIGRPSPTFDIGFYLWDFDSLQDSHLARYSHRS